MQQPTIQWQEWTEKPKNLGHGIHYHDSKQLRGKDLVAFIEGFSWLRDSSAIVKGYHIKPNAVTTEDVINDMKQRVEELVREQNFEACGMISPRIRGMGNC